MIRRKILKLIISLSLLSVENVLGQQEIGLNTKYLSPLFDFDYNKPVFRLKDEQLKNKHGFLRFSVLTSYREGVEPVKEMGNLGSSIDMEQGTSRTYMINLSILDMVTFGFVKPNRVILEVKDPSRYCYNSSLGDKLKWMRKNAYCFEYLSPYGTMKSTKIIKDEFAHYFDITFGNEKRLVNALVLIRTSTQDKIKTKGGQNGSYDKSGRLINLPLGELSKLFEDVGLPPMVNGTGYTMNVDLDLEIGEKRDLETIRKALQRYDLDLKEEKREIEMFVIRENQLKK